MTDHSNDPCGTCPHCVMQAAVNDAADEFFARINELRPSPDSVVEFLAENTGFVLGQTHADGVNIEQVFADMVEVIRRGYDRGQVERALRERPDTVQ